VYAAVNEMVMLGLVALHDTDTPVAREAEFTVKITLDEEKDGLPCILKR
jgi:hypothetical protein